MKVIGHIDTCYEEKFGIPRQPGLVKEAWGKIILEPEFRNPEALRELEGFSHLWLVFIFHQSVRAEWKPTVRPPRLGGNKRIGVFASRSPFRPNPIGLSAVKLEGLDLDHLSGPLIKVSGVDLVAGTPILDIKPYIPYADSIPGALGGYVDGAPSGLGVEWKEGVDQYLSVPEKNLIEATLSADPRPAYQHEKKGREYGCLISGYNIRWQVVDAKVLVLECNKS